MHKLKKSLHPRAKVGRRWSCRSCLVFLLPLLVGILSTGCAETAVGLGVAYAKGNLEVIVPADSKTTIAAAEATLRELDVTLTQTEYGTHKTVLIGRNPENRRYKIKIEDRGEDATKVAIRLGVFGKKLVVHDVYERLAAKLPEAPEQPVKPAPAAP